jgi:hypothetical protein
MIEMREQPIIEKQVKLDNQWFGASMVFRILWKFSKDRCIDSDDTIFYYPIVKAMESMGLIKKNNFIQFTDTWYSEIAMKDEIDRLMNEIGCYLINEDIEHIKEIVKND